MWNSKPDPQFPPPAPPLDCPSLFLGGSTRVGQRSGIWTLVPWMRSLGAAVGGAHLPEPGPPRPSSGGAVWPTNQRALGAGRGRSGSGRPLEPRERSETRRGAEGSKPALQSPSSPPPSPRRLLQPAAGPELCDPEVPVPLLCGINSNGGGCSSRNNSHTIGSGSGSGGGGSGLPHPYPHSHLPVPGGGGRGRQRRRLD